MELALPAQSVWDLCTRTVCEQRLTSGQVDTSVTFDQVGGLEHYVKALKEMVFLPLVYPELFERFHINPPRGVLFYGPPGTPHKAVWVGFAVYMGEAGMEGPSLLLLH